MHKQMIDKPKNHTMAYSGKLMSFNPKQLKKQELILLRPSQAKSISSEIVWPKSAKLKFALGCSKTASIPAISNNILDTKGINCAQYS